MDNFYRTHAALYKTLIGRFRPAAGPRSESVAVNPLVTGTTVSARIRPLLDEDIAAGFPCAIFPRAEQPGVVDIHDLYNHPRWRPMLKVSRKFSQFFLTYEFRFLIILHSPSITMLISSIPQR